MSGELAQTLKDLHMEQQIEAAARGWKEVPSWVFCSDTDLPPVVRPPSLFSHADKLIGVKVRVSGAGGRYPSALCGRRVL